MLLVFGALCQHKTLAGQEHGRTIPLSEVERASQQSDSLLAVPSLRLFAIDPNQINFRIGRAIV